MFFTWWLHVLTWSACFSSDGYMFSPFEPVGSFSPDIFLPGQPVSHLIITCSHLVSLLLTWSSLVLTWSACFTPDHHLFSLGQPVSHLTITYSHLVSLFLTWSSHILTWSACFSPDDYIFSPGQPISHLIITHMLTSWSYICSGKHGSDGGHLG